jgi:hypothetical protein
MLGRLIKNELGSVWKEAVMTYFRYYPDICLDGVKKTAKRTSARITDFQVEI